MSRPLYLLDTGPLVALLDRSDQNHEQAKSLFAQVFPPLLTCESVISEACFLTGKKGAGVSQKIISLGMDGFYKIPLVLEKHWKAIFDLLSKYQDQPISLADACLIRLAEIYQTPRILTFDTDFERYRWGRNKKFSILR